MRCRATWNSKKHYKNYGKVWSFKSVAARLKISKMRCRATQNAKKKHRTSLERMDFQKRRGAAKNTKNALSRHPKRETTKWNS